MDYSHIGVVQRAGSRLLFNSLDDLFKNYRVGLVSTYVYPREVMSVAAKYPENLVYAPNELALLKMLSQGRQDCVITDPVVMDYLAEQEGTVVVDTAKILMRKELVLAFRDDEDNRARLELLNQLIQAEN